MEEKKYRIAFVTQSSRASQKYWPLQTMAEQVEFITVGLESQQQRTELIAAAAKIFDAARDIIVPDGSPATAALAVLMLSRGQPVTLGIWDSTLGAYTLLKIGGSYAL